MVMESFNLTTTRGNNAMMRRFSILMICTLMGAVVSHQPAQGAVTAPVTDGLIVALDGSDVTTAGAQVSSWNDLTANHLNATQTTSAHQPTLVPNATTAGTPAIAFDGSDDRLEIGANALFDAGALTWYIVFQTDQPTTNGRRLVNGSYSDINPDPNVTQPAGLAWNSFIGSNGMYRTQGRSTTNTFLAANSPTGLLNATDFYIGGSIWDGATGNLTNILIDGSDNRSVNTASGADMSLSGHQLTYIGGGASMSNSTFTSSSAFDGKIAELLIYNRELSAAEQQQVEQYLYDKHFQFVPPVEPDFTSYHIGNSLTWDSRPEWMDDLAAQKGLGLHRAGWHDRGGASLSHLWANPEDINVTPAEPYGSYPNALPNYKWSAVTLQTYEPFAEDATLADETQAALNFINLTRTNPQNDQTVFYILGAWPRSDSDYATAWLAEFPDDGGKLVERSRAFYETMLARVRAGTEAEVYIIPTGEVIYQLKLLIDKGELAGITSVDQLYRDSTHLSLDFGRYIAGATMFATLHRVNPEGLYDPDYPDLNDPNNPFSAEIYTQLNNVIWDVVSHYQYSGVPEPGTMGLLGTGVLLAQRRVGHRHD